MLYQVGKWIVVTAMAALVVALCACAQRPAKVANYGDKFYGFSSSDYSYQMPASVPSDSTDGMAFGPGSKKYVWITVERGDSLSKIAQDNDVPLSQIARLNGLKPPYTLEVGQQLRLGKAKYHVVERGDTLKNIAKDYDVSLNQLIANNNLSSPNNIMVGQKIYMPGAKRPSSGNRTSVASTKKQKRNTESLSKKKDENFARNEEKNEDSSTNVKMIVAGAPEFAWPVKGKVIEGFGPRKGGVYNDGINIAAPEGSAVKASADGTVVYVGSELKAYGNLVIIKHDNGWLTAYAHNKEILVTRGQKVNKGATIARVGSSGKVSVPQLHFAVRKGREAVNPTNFISG